MSEVETSTISEGSEPVVHLGAGALLKQAREASGLHIAALAVLLKVPVKKLEALESDRLDLLPDAVFVRALASSVCRTLKIDSADILARLPQTDAPKLIYQGTGINAPFRSPGDGPGPSVWAQVSRPAVISGLVLLLAALVLIFLPTIKSGIDVMEPELGGSVTKNVDIEKTTSAAAVPEAYVVPSTPSISSTTLVPLTSSSVSIVPSEPSSVVAATTAIVKSPLPGKNSVTVTVSTPLPISGSNVISPGTSSPTFVVTPNALSASDVVVFTAKTESWVEATDAKGQVVLRRVLNAGEVAGASGALPLKVVVGRANATTVQVRGKLFDLTTVAKDNVARFEVK